VTTPSDYPTLSFRTPEEWEAWLEGNHADTDGIWIRIYKKGSGQPTVTYDEALDVALCFGWIDGQSRRLDEASYVQKFTPRRKRSGWSKRNTEHVERLTAAGRMRPAGLAQVEAAKADGRWEAAYAPPSEAKPPAEFLAALGKSKRAQATFDKLNRQNVFAITYRVTSAKRAETRKRRIRAIIDMLARGEKLYP
jgi:uncharacterized protein YdeI (YjbR/CyaY-like superfamily)